MNVEMGELQVEVDPASSAMLGVDSASDSSSESPEQYSRDIWSFSAWLKGISRAAISPRIIFAVLSRNTVKSTSYY